MYPKSLLMYFFIIIFRLMKKKDVAKKTECHFTLKRSLYLSDIIHIFINQITNFIEMAKRFPITASHAIGRGFPSRPGHAKDDHKIGTNYLPA